MACCFAFVGMDLSGDEDLIYCKLERKNFSLENVFVKDDKALVASLLSPFFMGLGINLEQNYECMQGNLTLIASLAK